MRRPYAAIVICLGTFSWFIPKEAAAAGPAHYDLARTNWEALSIESLSALGAYGGVWLATGGPRATCRWCDSNGFDESMRSSLRAPHPRTIGFLSHGVSLGAVPALALTGLIVPAYRDGETGRALSDAWIVANTFVITTAVGNLAKHWVARERPAFHHGMEAETEMRNFPNERNKSFFSLDTAWAFAIASSATTLAHLHGYESRNYIAIGGGALAVAAGTLRIVGDAHWTTDVLTGAAVGTAIGIAVPALLHPRETNSQTAVSVSALGRGTGVSLSFAF